MKNKQALGYPQKIIQTPVPEYNQLIPIEKIKKDKSTRKQTTQFLSSLLERDRLRGSAGKYWAKEVVIDYGLETICRIDYMQYEPINQISIDGLEKGCFRVFEIKSCKADFNSGYGQNYICEYNHIVMTMHTYKELLHSEINELPHYVGILVAIPKDNSKTNKDALLNEFENPTPLPEDYNIDNWHLVPIKNAFQASRKKSILELMFCLMRSRRAN